MKNFLTSAFLACVVLSSCSSGSNNEAAQYPPPAPSGQKLFSKGTCQTCHMPDQLVIGPSIATIKEHYQANPEDLKRFLRGEKDPIIEPEKFDQMKINLRYTQSLSPSELDSLVNYLLK